MNSTANLSPDLSEPKSRTSTPTPTEGGEKWKQAVLMGEVVIEDVTNKSRSQTIYEAMGNSKRVLVTLCIGLNRENGAPLIDLSESPWSQELKGTMKPTNRELAMEVCRRQNLLAGTNGTSSKQFKMKPKNKPREVLLEWLNSWPVRDANCLTFLFTEAQRVEDLLQASLDEGRENAIAMQHGAWTGPLPYLRLIHSITDCNETRLAYLKRNDPKTREELDAANSPIRPKTAYEIIADKWNDPDFHPVTQVSNCHVDFASSIDLCHSKVASLTPADAIGVQNRLSSMRVTLLRIIEKWEQSGQGDGGRADETEEEQLFRWGQLEGRPQEALDTRENFLCGNPSWYLYLWEITDTYQLLDSTLQRLSEGVGASDATSIASVSRHRRRLDGTEDNDYSSQGTDLMDGSIGVSLVENITKISNILRELIETNEHERQEAKKLREDDRLAEKERQTELRIANLKDSIDEYEEKFGLTEKPFYENILKRKRDEVEHLERLLEKIVASRATIRDHN